MAETFLQEMYTLLDNKKNSIISGLSGTARAFFLQEICRRWQGTVLCLVPGEEKAYDLYHNLTGLIDAKRIELFLGRNFVFLKENYSYSEGNRMQVLRSSLKHPRRSQVIIATPASFLYLIMAPQQMQDNTIWLEKGMEAPLEALLHKLVDRGMKRTTTVHQPGEFALRGGILDIFPTGDSLPARMEFFGDAIESIRRFDLDSQRSTKNETLLEITPVDELSGENLQATVLEYLNRPLVFWDEPREFMKTYDKEMRRYHESVKEARQESTVVHELPVLQAELLRHKIAMHPVIYHSFFPGNIPQAQAALLRHISQQDMEPFYGDLAKLLSRLKEWQKRQYHILLAVKSRPARERLQTALQEENIVTAEFIDGNVEQGFISKDLETVMVGERDIWGKTASRPRKKARDSGQRLLLEDLNPGDYIVHESYGVGIFRGVTHVENQGVTREYILLQYAGTDRLYLPVEKLDVLYKYHASEEKPPRLSKLGGSDWEKTKQRVAQSIQEMAESLLKLYASRQARAGFAFSPDTPWQRQFEDDFPYQVTPDQEKAIRDVKRDMESTRPMDRLICGDVGYGKTEVAMRAAFKAVMDGKQVAVLVPTTVLAEQHFQTFQERFSRYPAEIQVLSRFKSPSEQKRIISDLKKGLVDIIIGTHRLLSKDLEFKDLGLLVIDEEHRFGVAQKEKVKKYKELVDVISLSATPIPRSLHMSLTGLRDLSVIETPPPGRYPVTTYVMEFNEDIVLEAIREEIKRGGQVFFVHNRIGDIESVDRKLQESLPGITIKVGHGRMKEEVLGKVMSDFVQGLFPVLLCTTIIESGLDLPNVNTMIVDEADKMGLAQLYQLRGRVGRSQRIAFAYLTYRPDRILNETAQKRLNAIREFNELGAGMRIALRDLEIRGAGNILGPEQHGYIQAVGFDLYCRLLEQETSRLKGVTVREYGSTSIDVDMDNYIPDSYIPDAGTKIRIYRRLLLASGEEEIAEVRAELLDRFGALPGPVENFLQISLLRVLARGKDIRSLRRKGKEVEIHLNQPLSLEFIKEHQEHIKQIKEQGQVVMVHLPDSRSLRLLQEILEKI